MPKPASTSKPSRVVKKGDEPLHGTSLSAERGIVTVYDENEEPAGTFAIPGRLSMSFGAAERRLLAGAEDVKSVTDLGGVAP